MRKIRKLIIKFCCFVFKNNRIVLFESIPDYADNSIDLFIALKKKGYKTIWCTHGEPRDKHSIKIDGSSLKYVIIETIASHTFYSHAFIGNIDNKYQKRCFLTHGMSFKNTKGSWEKSTWHTNIVCISELHRELRSITMPNSENLTVVLGYPRNDRLFNQNRSVLTNFEIPETNKLIMWLPSFRHLKNPNGYSRSDYSDNNKKEFDLLNSDTLSAIDEYLEGKKYTLIVKYHPNQDLSYISKMPEYKNIKVFSSNQFVNFGINLYDLLSVTEALITDFSSVYIDYLLTNKPIAFDIADLDAFSKGLGFTVDNPKEYMPGPLMQSKADIINFIKDVIENNDCFVNKRETIRNLVHEYKDGNSTKRIIDYYGL